MENKNPFLKFTVLELFAYIYSKRKVLIIATLIGAIASIIVAMTITPKYKSNVVIITSLLSNYHREVLNDYEVPTYVFGEEDESDQYIQVLNSTQVKDKIIEKYNLLEHWDIDSNGIPKYLGYLTYNGNVTIKRTRNLCVEVEVLDKNPEYALGIANDIVAYGDTLFYEMKKYRAEKVVEIIGKEMQVHEQKLNELQDSLKCISEKGIYDYKSQAKEYNRAFAQAMVQGNVAGANRLIPTFKNMEKYGGKYLELESLIEKYSEHYFQLYRKYEEAKVEANSHFPNYFKVDKGYKADVKAYPRRSIIVIASTIATFLFALMAIIILESFKNIKIESL